MFRSEFSSHGHGRGRCRIEIKNVEFEIEYECESESMESVGLQMWKASLFLASILTHPEGAGGEAVRRIFSTPTCIVELGAGVGICSWFFGASGEQRKVLCTDFEARILALARDNYERNRKACLSLSPNASSVQFRILDITQGPEQLSAHPNSSNNHGLDSDFRALAADEIMCHRDDDKERVLIVACDLVYDAVLSDHLLNTLFSWMLPDSRGEALLVLEKRPCVRIENVLRSSGAGSSCPSDYLVARIRAGDFGRRWRVTELDNVMDHHVRVDGKSVDFSNCILLHLSFE